MEVAILLLVIVPVLAYYGVFGMLDVGTAMGTRRLKQFERTQKQAIKEELQSMEIKADEWAEASANAKLIDDLDI